MDADSEAMESGWDFILAELCPDLMIRLLVTPLLQDLARLLKTSIRPSSRSRPRSFGRRGRAVGAQRPVQYFTSSGFLSARPTAGGHLVPEQPREVEDKEAGEGLQHAEVPVRCCQGRE